MMKKKIFIILLVIYVGQFLSSCCRDYETIEVTFSDVTATSFQIIDNGLNLVLQGDKVDKLKFVLSIYVQENYKKIASNFTDFSGFGFQKSYAVITCPEDKFVYVENIDAITIYQIDTNNNKIDVTNNFKTKDFDNQFITITDFIATRNTWQNSFEFFLQEEKDIENDARFEVVLESSTNQTLSFKTEEVQFN